MKPSTWVLPSPTTVLIFVLLTYFLVTSGFVYDVIVEPPGIGSKEDPVTGAMQPVVFLLGRVNGKYIIEGLSSWFTFVLGGLGLITMDLAIEKTRGRNVRLSLMGSRRGLRLRFLHDEHALFAHQDPFVHAVL